MNKFFIAAWILLVPVLTGCAGNLSVTILDGGQNAVPYVTSVVAAQDFPQPTGTGIAVIWRTSYQADATGTFIITNCVPGGYLVTPLTNNARPFYTLMPATNGTVYAVSNLIFTPPQTLGTNYPTFAQGDLRWGSASATNINNATGTNVNLSGTNGQPLVANFSTPTFFSPISSGNMALFLTNSGPEVDVLMTANSQYGGYPVHVESDPDGFEIQIDNPVGWASQGTVFSVDPNGNSYTIGNVYAGYNEGNNFNTNGAFYGRGDGLTHVPAASLTGVINPAQLPGNVVTNNQSMVNLSGNFTNLTAIQLLSAPGYNPLNILFQAYQDEGGDAAISLFNGDAVELRQEAGDGYILYNCSQVIYPNDPNNIGINLVMPGGSVRPMMQLGLPSSSACFTVASNGVVFGNGLGLTNLTAEGIRATNAPVNGYALRYTNGNFYWAP